MPQMSDLMWLNLFFSVLFFYFLILVVLYFKFLLVKNFNKVWFNKELIVKIKF